MPCPYPKGSQEAKEFMAHLRAKRGKAVCGGKTKKGGQVENPLKRLKQQIEEHRRKYPHLFRPQGIQIRSPIEEWLKHQKGGQLEKESLASLKKRLWKEVREHHIKYPHTKLPLEIRQIAEEIRRRTNPRVDDEEKGREWRRKWEETRKAEAHNLEIENEWIKRQLQKLNP